jgi:hypothetical protein
MKCELTALTMPESPSFPKQLAQLAKKWNGLQNELRLFGKELERLKLLPKDFCKESEVFGKELENFWKEFLLFWKKREDLPKEFLFASYLP